MPYPFHQAIDNQNLGDLESLLKSCESDINPFNTKAVTTAVFDNSLLKSETRHFTPLAYALYKIKNRGYAQRDIQSFALMLEYGLGFNERLPGIPPGLNQYFNEHPFFGFGSFSAVLDNDIQDDDAQEDNNKSVIKRVECHPITTINALRGWIENSTEENKPIRINRLVQFIKADFSNAKTPKDRTFFENIQTLLREFEPNHEAVNAVYNPLHNQVNVAINYDEFTQQLLYLNETILNIKENDLKAILENMDKSAIKNTALEQIETDAALWAFYIEHMKEIEDINHTKMKAQENYHVLLFALCISLAFYTPLGFILYEKLDLSLFLCLAIAAAAIVTVVTVASFYYLVKRSLQHAQTSHEHAISAINDTMLSLHGRIEAHLALLVEIFSIPEHSNTSALDKQDLMRRIFDDEDLVQALSTTLISQEDNNYRFFKSVASSHPAKSARENSSPVTEETPVTEEIQLLLA